MTRAVQERLALAAASVVLVAAVLAATIGVPGSDDDPTLASETPVPATTATPAATTTASPARPAAPQSPGDPTAAPTDPPAAAIDPGPASPPRPGTYRYREVGSDGQTSEETVRYVERDGGRQSEVHSEVSSEIEWRADGKYILETTFGNPPQAFRCDWNPDILEYRLPLSAGTTWRVDGSCDAAPGFRIEFTASSRVLGAERVSIGGQDVDSWRIASEGTLTFRTPDSEATQTITGEDWFSPRHGLSVRSKERLRGRDLATGEEIDETSSSELLSLTPS